MAQYLKEKLRNKRNQVFKSGEVDLGWWWPKSLQKTSDLTVLPEIGVYCMLTFEMPEGALDLGTLSKIPLFKYCSYSQ